MALTQLDIRPENRRQYAEWEQLLQKAGIRKDPHVDGTVALADDDGGIVAAGSYFGHTLRCLAVDPAHRGEDLLATLVTLLSEKLYEQGQRRLFLYTKCETAPLFVPLGFHEVARVPGKTVFMENQTDGFARYLTALSRGSGRQSAIVMNANPFTNGHRYLVEQAKRDCDTLHLFVVSEDASEIPFPLRWHMVTEGVADMSGVLCHESGPYLISRATFPSYFLRQPQESTLVQAELDANIFLRIADALDVTERVLGEEPKSIVTDAYNRVLMAALPAAGIRCRILPRLTARGGVVSASWVRLLLTQGDFEGIRALVPETTLRVLRAAYGGQGGEQ